MSKVFGIGFHKTGTGSLGRALEILGYKNCFGAHGIRTALGDARMMQALFKEDYEPIMEFAKDYDAFNDLPWFAIYQALDKQFPNSKFILTYREENAWLESASRYFGNTVSPFRLWLYGKANPKDNEEVYLDRYRRHKEEVLTYFQDRNDFLLLDIANENKWELLCAFLEKPIPDEVYPHFHFRGKR